LFKKNNRRKDMVKLQLRGKVFKFLLGFIIGGLVLAAFTGCGSSTNTSTNIPLPGSSSPVWQSASLFYPGETLASDEMRITFVGTSCIPRMAQECNSIYVELGNGEYFMFDMGSGVSAKYCALGIPYSKLDKVFLTHLHGDHTSDLITMYTFGPCQDRKTPLKIWGPSGNIASEGTAAFCTNLINLMKWHELSFSFEQTGYGPGNDGYDINCTELDWKTTGIAYNQNGVTITHFPAAHTRNGSISYRLDWNGLSMVFSGDTKPNDYMIANAQGVDVLIHEMVVPPEVWAAKNGHIDSSNPAWPIALKDAQDVQDSSHTPEVAFGYIMSKTNPRLAVATHFQYNDDTVPQAMDNIRKWYQGQVAIATDLMVLNVSKTEIRQRRAVVSEYSWYPKPKIAAPGSLAPPMFPTPTAQLDTTILLNHCIPESVYNK
jgi:ribonuclease Z